MNVTRTRWTAVLMGLFVAAAYLAAPASAMPADDDRATLEQYAGVYILPSGVRFIVEVRRGMMLIRPASWVDASEHNVTPPSLRRLDHRADAILTGLSRGETTALRMALASQVRRNGEADISHLFETFTGVHGALEQFVVLGTVSEGPHQAMTLVHMSFAEGTEVVRLLWHDGELATIQRGAHWSATEPAAQVTFREVRRARSKAAAVTFNLRPDGRVESMTVGGRYGAVTAYRLDAWPAASITAALR